MAITDQQIDDAIPDKGSSTPDPQKPNRRLTNAILKELRDAAQNAAPKSGNNEQTFAVDDPGSDDDATPKGYADGRYARLSGGDDADFQSMPKVDGDYLVKEKDAATLSRNTNDFDHMPQVDGDPIVESGSSSAGSWTKWADGTAMCFIRITSDPSDGVKGIGAGSYSDPYRSDKFTITYPIQFVDDVFVATWTRYSGINGVNRAVWADGGDMLPGKSDCSLVLYAMGNPGTFKALGVLVVGRYK